MKNLAAAILLCGAVGMPHKALCDEQIVPLAQSGDWMAAEHTTSMTAPPDVCMAVDNEGDLAFRSDGTSVEIRSQNQSWSLPDGVQGTVEIIVNGNTYTFNIDSNTDKMIDAEVDPSKVSPILDDIAKASSLQMTIGKAKPITVSLSGSAAALNAFRTCAGISGSAPGAGTNPFQ
jgi:hypothetical protein